MSTARLDTWDPNEPNLRDWSDDELLAALASCGVTTSRAAFIEQATDATQAQVEDRWLAAAGELPEATQAFVWMAVHELWERWQVPSWPADRLARMFAYLVDAEFSAAWAQRFHAPTAMTVMDALASWLAAQDSPRAAVDDLVGKMNMPPQAWAPLTLEAMIEWAEVGNHPLALRGGAFLTAALGRGHERAYYAAALVAGRMIDRAQGEALQVPLDADLDGAFRELVGALCLAAGSAAVADRWLQSADKMSGARQAEHTYAHAAVRDFLAGWRRDGARGDAEVPPPIRGAAKQAAAQTAHFAFMAFAGTGQITPR